MKNDKILLPIIPGRLFDEFRDPIVESPGIVIVPVENRKDEQYIARIGYSTPLGHTQGRRLFLVHKDIISDCSYNHQRSFAVYLDRHDVKEYLEDPLKDCGVRPIVKVLYVLGNPPGDCSERESGRLWQKGLGYWLPGSINISLGDCTCPFLRIGCESQADIMSFCARVQSRAADLVRETVGWGAWERQVGITSHLQIRLQPTEV